MIIVKAFKSKRSVNKPLSLVQTYSKHLTQNNDLILKPKMCKYIKRLNEKKI